MGWFGYANGSAEVNIIVEMSEIGTFKLDESVNEAAEGVGGNDALCCGLCVGETPKPALAEDDVGVRPGTASKKSVCEDDDELYEASKPRFARCD